LRWRRWPRASSYRRSSGNSSGAAAQGNAANVELGLALTGKLAVKKLTREHALFFAYEVLGRENRQNAFRARPRTRRASRRECAARVMTDWITVETKTLKSGKIKTTVIYLDGHAAEKRMWDYVKAAKSPEEILQRTLHVYAAAAFFKRECGPNGKEPMNQFPAQRHSRRGAREDRQAARANGGKADRA